MTPCPKSPSKPNISLQQDNSIRRFPWLGQAYWARPWTQCKLVASVSSCAALLRLNKRGRFRGRRAGSVKGSRFRGRRVDLESIRRKKITLLLPLFPHWTFLFWHLLLVSDINYQFSRKKEFWGNNLIKSEVNTADKSKATLRSAWSIEETLQAFWTTLKSSVKRRGHGEVDLQHRGVAASEGGAAEGSWGAGGVGAVGRIEAKRPGRRAVHHRPGRCVRGEGGVKGMRRGREGKGDGEASVRCAGDVICGRMGGRWTTKISWTGTMVDRAIIDRPSTDD